MYTLTAGQGVRIDLWNDQAVVVDRLYVRLRFNKLGRKTQPEVTVEPVVSAFTGGALLAFYVQAPELPPTLPDELGNLFEFGEYTMYVETSDNGVNWAVEHVNVARILRPAEAEAVVDGGPSEDTFRGIIDGGTP